ncbi:MAG: NAD-dependent epimerase/dehydratase family protein, partial [Pseudomonadota bacterium]
AYAAFVELVRTLRPDAIVHFAEQRSVPYSAISAQAGLYTMRNNVMATTNTIMALVESGVDAHLVHLGSLGVYGYETLGYEVPEGYMKVRRVLETGELGPDQDVLHPFNPVSLYHLTKAMDHLGMAHFARRSGLRATDLHQGTVWGASTPETEQDPRLANRFDYDPVFGTVINRFAVQAALGKPISVYGSGNQTRGFIHLHDVLNCIVAALSDPPAKGDRVRVINQTAETCRIADLAQIFTSVSESELVHLPSPRAEPEANELVASNASVIGFGLTPTRVTAETVRPLIDCVQPMLDTVDLSLLYPVSSATD